MEKKMNDDKLIQLYENRDESAIEETARQYGTYCHAIAMNILHNRQDAEECVNDAYLNVWNAIPPDRPKNFSSFIGAITRNLSLNKYKSKNTQKRGSSGIDLIFSELEDCIPAAGDIAEKVELNDLMRIIDKYLSSIKHNDMVFFMRRYFYGDTVMKIAEQFCETEGKVTMSLHRTRKKLKTYLEKEGVTL